MRDDILQVRTSDGEHRVALSLATERFLRAYPGYKRSPRPLRRLTLFWSASVYQLFHLIRFAGSDFLPDDEYAFPRQHASHHRCGKEVSGAKSRLAAAWFWGCFLRGFVAAENGPGTNAACPLMLCFDPVGDLRLLGLASPLHWSGIRAAWVFTAMVTLTICIWLPFPARWIAFRRCGSARASGTLLLMTVFLLFLLCAPGENDSATTYA